MHRSRLFRLGLPILLLAACGEEQSPTAPTSGGAPDKPSLSQAAGLKVVNSLADPGDGVCTASHCTLREAINDPASTEITFAAGLIGPITLAPPADGGGRLEIDKPLTITGPSQRIAIRGRSPDLAFPVFRIGESGTVTLTNLTIRRGGRGILNRGTLTVTNCLIAGNSGDGIFTGFGDLTLTHSLVVENTGGGVSVLGGTATLGNSRIARNSSSGIRVGNGTVTLRKSTIAGNSAGDGGGVFLSEGSLTVVASTIANNTATGQGGGVFNRSSNVFRRGGAVIRLTNSTVSGNFAASGGGIANSPHQGSAVLTLTNTTVTGNSATQQGGGVFQNGPTGEEDQGFLTITNSLVAQNSAPTGPDVLILQGFLTPRFNLIGNGSGSGITNGVDGNQVGTAGAPIDPKLGPLADNDGPTRTHALLLGSPAIDAASTPDCPPTDQRGVLRPQGAACDIGSYERE
jgi:CSLREA domain-containing protein